MAVKPVENYSNIELVNSYGEYLIENGRGAYNMYEATHLFQEILKRLNLLQEILQRLK